MWGVVLVLVYFGAALIAAAIVLQKDWFRVTRSAIIDAPSHLVFAQINELRNWEAWSPWAKLDPQAQKSYDGPAAGVGAAFEWSGDAKVGAGRMTIVDSRPNESVNIKLEMKKPFAAANDVSFVLEPEGGEAAAEQGSWLARALGFGGASTRAARTKVTWSISGRNTLILKAVNLVRNRDKMVGAEFEKGLANMNVLFSK